MSADLTLKRKIKGQILNTNKARKAILKGKAWLKQTQRLNFKSNARLK